ncbi:Galactose-1-phosphate uridylyltransferase [Nymphon striatum]|nr:Galactose-1-phosphate uridylyltransferase [Nymphon striatum]
MMLLRCVAFIPENDSSCSDLLQCSPAEGTCRVMCFHPSTNITIPEMENSFVLNIIEKWIRELEELGKDYKWVQIFENKGAIMGCSNPHPHCQIWASTFLPNVATTEDRTQKNYFAKHGRPLLVDYVKLELKEKSRIVIENKFWVALVPFWAQWPYETMLIPKRHILRLSDLTSVEQSDLADIIKKLLTKYDNLFQVIFPYSMGWHGAPTGSYFKENTEHWQLHAEYYPPLLRSHSIKKFMVGYEMLATPQRDLTAEKSDQSHFYSNPKPTIHCCQFVHDYVLASIPANSHAYSVSLTIFRFLSCSEA